MANKAVLDKYESDSAKSHAQPRWPEIKDNSAHITVVGLSYKTAPVRVREMISASRYGVKSALPIINSRVGPSVILSTRGRLEVYSVVSDPPVAFEGVRRFLAEAHGVEPGVISPHLYELANVDAARHLHQVASGLDSMVLGNSHIQDQVRKAMSVASALTSSPMPALLTQLFRNALGAGRRVRDETSIGKDAPSLGQAAVELARRRMGGPSGLRVLLIGAGDAGKLVAKELIAAGGGSLVVATQTEDQGVEPATQLGAQSVPFSEIGRVLHGVDVVICAATSPKSLITGDMVSQVIEKRRNQPMCLFDLTMPRNIDPSTGALKDVHLFNIDDIGLIAWQKSQSAQTGVVEAEEIVEEELGVFLDWWDSLEAVHLMGNLQEHAESVRLKELDRTMRKMAGFNEDHREQLDAMTRSIVKQLLHRSIVSLKSEAGNSRRRLAKEPLGSGGERGDSRPRSEDRSGPRRPINYLAQREAA